MVKRKTITDEPIEGSTRDKLLHCFIEHWNEMNPGKKLDSDMIELVSEYLPAAYVAGWDDFRILVEGRLNNYTSTNANISKHFLLLQIYEFDKKI
ncbi:MAG TPA: hypothetical protein ENH82_03910 [bacterium]|nr:hypothetical protein [bacterium]